MNKRFVPQYEVTFPYFEKTQKAHELYERRRFTHFTTRRQALRFRATCRKLFRGLVAGEPVKIPEYFDPNCDPTYANRMLMAEDSTEYLQDLNGHNQEILWERVQDASQASDAQIEAEAERHMPVARLLSSDDFIPEYPLNPEETSWYVC